VGWSETLFFVALARAAEWCVSKLSTQDLSNMAWAFLKAAFGRTDQLLVTVLRKAMERSMGNFKEQCLANVVWQPT